jgi:hypothetical protein
MISDAFGVGVAAAAVTAATSHAVHNAAPAAAAKHRVAAAIDASVRTGAHRRVGMT